MGQVPRLTGVVLDCIGKGWAVSARDHHSGPWVQAIEPVQWDYAGGNDDPE
jgi:hypothetical protein